MSTINLTTAEFPTTIAGHSIVLVDFWASWCVPCVKSFPFLNTLHRELKGRGLEVVAVDVDEHVPDGAAFLRNHQAQFTVGSDPRGDCPKAFGLHGMPTSYLIDRQGVVRLVHTGYRDGEAVEVRHQIETVLMEDGQGPIAPAASHDMDHMEHMDHAQADH